MFDFPKADPVPRGCGERTPGGVYVESGLSPYGRPLEEFLIDPPLPVPPGLDLIHKPQLWQRTLPTGEIACDADGQPIVDLLIWVGSEYYPYCPDFVEEVRRFGASRRLNPNLDLSRLSRASRMILVHPSARNLAWQSQTPPDTCHKALPGHAKSSTATPDRGVTAYQVSDEKRGADDISPNQHRLLTMPEGVVPPPADPCLFKVWELIPLEAAQTVLPAESGTGAEDDEDDEHVRQKHPSRGRPLCLRAIGSTVYQYRPTGESTDGLAPGIFATLPITGFAFIRFADGLVNERAKAKVEAGRDTHGEQALPWYDSDR